MGGGGRGYLFKLVLGRGASFLGGSNSSLKKIKTSTIWKDFCDKRLPQICYGGGASPIMSPPPHAEKEIPPPPPHTEKMAWPPRTWREKTAHIKNTPIGKTPPTWIFFIHAPPHLASAYIPPLRAPIMISTHFIRFV